MNILLVSPKFPTTYWGFQYSMPFIRKRVSLPPLGLISVAALLPREWQLRLVDLNARPLADEEILWADAVLIGGMLVQAESMHEVIARCRRLGRRSIAGGPAPSSTPEDFRDADVVFCGEAEGRQAALMEAITSPRVTTPVLSPGGDRPAMEQIPTPRFDLLAIDDYASMSIQYSRGCPFHCEFCDIVELFGRRPRVKSPAQILGELTALHALGFRGSIFFVDDNFIGNKPAVKQLLPELARWQATHRYPFELYTEASVNLAADPSLVRAMVSAGFVAVFLGIETPSPDALAAANKKQNLRLDLADAIDSLSRAGLQVMGGFIVGFDQDDASALAAQRAFVSTSPIPLAMVGLLTALPNTQLWRRLRREGRLREASTGDQFGRPNFEPAMDEVELLRGYASLMSSLYAPGEYYRRCAAHLERAPRVPGNKKGLGQLPTFARAAFGIGIASPRRRHFWKLLARTLAIAPHNFPHAVGLAIQGEHLIRYTAEDVVPRLERAVTEAQRAPSRALREGKHVNAVSC